TQLFVIALRHDPARRVQHFEISCSCPHDTNKPVRLGKNRCNLVSIQRVDTPQTNQGHSELETGHIKQQTLKRLIGPIWPSSLTCGCSFSRHLHHQIRCWLLYNSVYCRCSQSW